MYINGSPMQWAVRMKYLGVTLLEGKRWQVGFTELRRKYFASVNSILSKCTYTSDVVKLELMESQCLPILMYAIESLSVKGAGLCNVNSCWNAVYPKIFNFNKWDSVKCLISYLGRLDALHIIGVRRITFIKRLLSCNNSVMSCLCNAYVNGPEFINLQKRCNVSVTYSCAKIKALTYIAFKEICARKDLETG